MNFEKVLKPVDKIGKCFYHSADLDGQSSGAIVNKIYGSALDYIGYNYGDIDISTINKGELIIFVDCSYDFNKLLDITKNIIWIDHHYTAIEKYESLKLNGIRTDKKAACELTWEFFYHDMKIPKVIELFADHDIWKYEFGEITSFMQMAARIQDTSINSPIWTKWLDPNYDPDRELKDGYLILTYKRNQDTFLMKRSFHAEYLGYKLICCNGIGNLQTFDSIKEDYDIAVLFSWFGENWRISLFTRKDIDVGEIAKNNGGGGHKKAAGFSCDVLPWTIIKD